MHEDTEECPAPLLARLEAYVEALEKVCQREELQEVNMVAVNEPHCGSPGCHAGLARAALDLLGVPRIGERYDFEVEALRLSNYLMEVDEEDHDPKTELYIRPDIRVWAEANPEIWGNRSGLFMFSSKAAFFQDHYRFPSTVIVDHWWGVLSRYRDSLPLSLSLSPSGHLD